MMNRRNGKMVGLATVLACAGLAVAGETNRIERGALTFEYGSLVFTTPASTNRFPLADRKSKKIGPLPGLSVVSFDERVLMTKEGETTGISTIHLKTTAGEQFALDEHEPLPVLLETRSTADGGGTNTVYVWRVQKGNGASNQPPQDTRGP